MSPRELRQSAGGLAKTPTEDNNQRENCSRLGTHGDPMHLL